MIPILWRYTAASYLKTFFLTLGTFVLVLVVSRFKEIALFTTVSPDIAKIGLFAVYQIPFILPMAIPLSALIASFLFFQKISRSQELTALRSCGLGLKKIITPMVIACLLLTSINFSICATLAPYCQRQAEQLLIAETSSAPLLLLQQQQLLKGKDAFLNLTVAEDGHTASSVILVTYNEGTKHLNLITAQSLALDNQVLSCENVSIVSHLPGHPGHPSQFEPLAIETQDSMSMGTELFASLIKKNPRQLPESSYSLRMLQADLNNPKAIGEIFRRISFSLSVLSLTLLGAFFGIEQGRTPSKKNLMYLLVLTILALSSYLLGKNFKHLLTLSAAVYFGPHFIIWICCYSQAKKIEKGLA